MTTQQDTQAFFEKYRLLLNAGETLSLPVLGNSMSPFLVHQRDTVWLRKPDRPLRKGDIVLYQRSNGAYILHRICGTQKESFTMIGDAHQTPEPGITDPVVDPSVAPVPEGGTGGQVETPAEQPASGEEQTA